MFHPCMDNSLEKLLIHGIDIKRGNFFLLPQSSVGSKEGPHRDHYIGWETGM